MKLSSFSLARALVLIVSLALVWAPAVSAATWTDQADYTPGSVVTISGDNSDDAGYLPGETVHVDVSGPNGWAATCDGTADDAGAWSCQVTLSDGPEAVGAYEYTATGLESGTTENGSFTDAGFFIRAFATGPGYIAVTFEGDSVNGPPDTTDPDDIYTYFAADCTGAIDKYLPADETTNTDGTYDLADGISNIGSIQATAPSPITIGADTYVFSSWTVNTNGSIVGSATANPGCFLATSTSSGTFVTANYVLAPAGDPDLTATKTNDTNDFANAGDTFTWSIQVENEGDADATFAENDLLLLDDLPSGPTYTNVLVDDSNVTPGSPGFVNCGISADQLTCVAEDGSLTLEPGDYFIVSFDVTQDFGQIGTTLDNPREGGTCTADPNNVIAEDNGDDTAETNNDCSDSVGVTGIVVTRGACTFDYDTETAEETFRLIYTPDMNTSYYKMSASNPGQLYLNVFTFTDGQDITIDVPYPFVTTGGTPVHVYGDWTTTTGDNGKTCFSPSSQLWTQDTQIDYDGYATDAFGQSQTLTIDTPDDFEGWIFVRVHLDYGLKGITTSCARDDADAIGCDPVGNIPNHQDYEFCFSDDGSGCTTIESINEFKRINGVAGLVVGANGEPLAGSTVQIWQGTKLWKTVVTDQDGWYMALFKYTGKATTFTVKWISLGVQASVTLKSNGFAQVNYIEGVSDVSIISTTSTDTSTSESGTKGRGPSKQ
jgi:uncharacterized repeat protein (TIGR01451 family)